MFSQKDEICLALGHIGQRRLAEACPHDKMWCTGLSACDRRASSPDTWSDFRARPRKAGTPLYRSLTPHRKPRFPGIIPSVRSSRQNRLPTFASTRPPYLPMPKRPRSRLSPTRCPMTMPLRHSLLTKSTMTRPSCLNKALI